jgi:hypothetical protein
VVLFGGSEILGVDPEEAAERLTGFYQLERRKIQIWLSPGQDLEFLKTFARCAQNHPTLLGLNVRGDVPFVSPMPMEVAALLATHLRGSDLIHQNWTMWDSSFAGLAVVGLCNFHITKQTFSPIVEAITKSNGAALTIFQSEFDTEATRLFLERMFARGSGLRFVELGNSRFLGKTQFCSILEKMLHPDSPLEELCLTAENSNIFVETICRSLSQYRKSPFKLIGFFSKRLDEYCYRTLLQHIPKMRIKGIAYPCFDDFDGRRFDFDEFMVVLRRNLYIQKVTVPAGRVLMSHSVDDLLLRLDEESSEYQQLKYIYYRNRELPALVNDALKKVSAMPRVIAKASECDDGVGLIYQALRNLGDSVAQPVDPNYAANS